MRPSQTSSARGCSLTCGIISRGCNCLRRWRWVKSKIILKLLVLTNCPSGDSDIILEQQAGAPWSLRVGLRPRIFAVEGKILPAHIFTHPWSHWCGILSAQNRGSEKPITPVPMSDIQHSRNYVSPASELEEGAFLFRDCCGNGRHYRKHVDGSFTLCFVDWLRCMSWNSNWIVAGESVPAGSSPWFHLLPCLRQRKRMMQMSKVDWGCVSVTQVREIYGSGDFSSLALSRWRSPKTQPGRPITASEAASYGLVSKVFPVEDLVEEAVKTADHIAGLSQVGQKKPTTDVAQTHNPDNIVADRRGNCQGINQRCFRAHLERGAEVWEEDVPGMRRRNIFQFGWN